jgi:hypothetical protein
MAHAPDYDPFSGPQTAGIDPEPDRSLIRMWGYVTHRPTWQGGPALSCSKVAPCREHTWRV